jgi:hypothetical protein
MWIKGKSTGPIGKRIVNRKNMVEWVLEILVLSIRLS